MAIYRFRILWEEDTEAERTILIKSNQTFLDFFNIITDGFELNNKNVSASFFTSDDYWDKHTEITLKEEEIQGDEKIMYKTKIASVIEQPKQRFVFVYDAKLQLTLLIELVKIEKDNIVPPNENLPKIISSKSKIPKRRRTIQTKNENKISDTTTNTNALSDDELDKIIYNSMMSTNITEEDILNNPIDELLKDVSKIQNTDMHEDDDDEDETETENFFDEENNMFDDDDFNEDGYYDTNNEHEN